MKQLRLKNLVLIALAILSFRPANSMANDNADAQLLRAVNLNEPASVKTWLEKGANPNYKYGERPVISVAAQNGYDELVQVLIDGHADINALDDIGQTPLMRAAESDKPKVLDVLVKAKAKLDVQNARGENALILAINNHSPSMVKSLVEAGANLNLKSTDDNTAAMAVAMTNADESAEIVSLLAKGKADLDVGNLMHTPLSYAISQGNVPLINALLKGGANPNLKAESGSFPIALAFGASDPKAIVGALLQAKVNPNVISSSGQTPLHMAAAQGLLAEVEALINAGAELNTKDNSGDTALAAAKRASHGDVAELLTKHGATV